MLHVHYHSTSHTNPSPRVLIALIHRWGQKHSERNCTIATQSANNRTGIELWSHWSTSAAPPVPGTVSSHFFALSQQTIHVDVGGTLGNLLSHHLVFSEFRGMKGLSSEHSNSRAGAGTQIWSSGFSCSDSHRPPGTKDPGRALSVLQADAFFKEIFIILERIWIEQELLLKPNYDK